MGKPCVNSAIKSFSACMMSLSIARITTLKEIFVFALCSKRKRNALSFSFSLRVNTNRFVVPAPGERGQYAGGRVVLSGKTETTVCTMGVETGDEVGETGGEGTRTRRIKSAAMGS